MSAACDVAKRPKTPPWVLIIDDDSDNRELLAEFLDSVGYASVACATAADGEAVLDVRGVPCLVIADVQMPDRDGVSFVEGMRKRPGLAKTPVIFVTGYHPSLLKTVGDEVMTKPFDLDALMDVVSKHCGLPQATPTVAA